MPYSYQKSYINAISNLTDRLSLNYSFDEWYEAENSLDRWKDARNKHEVEHFYDSVVFGICYAKQLYRSRVLCFIQVLKNLVEINGMELILTTSKNITSFGCGPGPEIAAYISFIRDTLGCDNFLQITAVDQLGYWQTFISEIAEIDSNVEIAFKKQTLNLEYLRNIRKSEVCIMSYPHAVKFDNIWFELKSKFSLIVVIDQAKYSLLNKVKSYGYKVIEFQSLGKKFFFYYLNQSGYDSQFSTDSKYCNKGSDYLFPVYSLKKVCERGHHTIDKWENNCKEPVDKTLTCGHKVEVKCYQYDENVKCLKTIEKKCERNIHIKSVQCNSKVICTELIESKLICGHSQKVQCYETPYECQQKIEYKLKCGHSIEISCRENESEKLNESDPYQMSYQCLKLVRKILKCGHHKVIRCHERENPILCSEFIDKKCAGNIHEKRILCGTVFICNETIKIKLNCGHFQEVKCAESDSYRTSLKCVSETVKLCDRGIHRHSCLCYEKVICRNLCQKKLQCCHSISVACYQYNDMNDKFCGKEFIKKCANGLHKNQIKCGIELPCAKSISIALFCGHKIIHVCGDINYSNRYQIECKVQKKCGHECATSCVCKMFSKINLTEKNEKYIENQISCGHGSERYCQQICDKILICEHKCKRICGLCQNGRLHQECMEICSKTVNCGHKCKGLCHQGECWECNENCFKNKWKKFSILNMINSIEIKREWKELKSRLSRKAPNEMHFFLKGIVSKLDKKSHSQFWLLQYRITRRSMEKVINFYNLVLNHEFNSDLTEYVDYLLNSITSMITWMDPDKRNISSSANYDFTWEYTRLSDIYKLLTVCSIEMGSGKIENYRKCQKILDDLFLVKYNFNSRIKLISGINSVIINS